MSIGSAVPQLTLSGTTLDLKPRRAHSDSLTITGVKLLTWLEPDGSVNLLKLAAMPATAAPAPSATAASPARSAEASAAVAAAGDAGRFTRQ